MREISTEKIVQTVAKLCQEANFYLPQEVISALKQGQEREKSPLGKDVLGQLLDNAQISAQEHLPLCQDTGMVVVFVEIGEDVHIAGNLYEAINEGVRQGYAQGYLRKSVVEKPFSSRINTKDNTPAIIYTEIVPGDRLKIMVMPKGGGAENMTQLRMLEPGEGRQGVIEFVVKAVAQAGSNPCPPVILGVGIGGTAEKAMLLAKKALLRPLGQAHPDPEVAVLEREILEQVNALGIGPEGFGGVVTALAVHIEVFPCHIASLPVAVNLQCHSARHKEAIL